MTEAEARKALKAAGADSVAFDRAAAMKELLTIKGYEPSDPIPSSVEFMRQREALEKRAGRFGKRQN